MVPSMLGRGILMVMKRGCGIFMVRIFRSFFIVQGLIVSTLAVSVCCDFVLSVSLSSSSSSSCCGFR